MANGSPGSLFRFRDCELDVAAFRLRRNGSDVRLERRPMELLVLLVSNRDRLVGREEIVQRLWPQGVVIDFDTGLNTLVSKVRHALGDSADHPACIETVPGKGYRFIAPVEAVGAVEPAPPGTEPRRRWRGIAAAALVLAGAIGAASWYFAARKVQSPATTPSPAASVVPSVAVLPFTDLSREQDQQYFSDGLAEEVLNTLTRSQRLRVIARTSSFSFRNRDVDIATIAAKLNVTHVLEGSVRKAGDRVRITVQLIDAGNSEHVWSQTYDRELTDVLDVQSDIANSVARTLHALLDDRRDASAGTTNPEAYDHFLRALYFFQRRAPGDLERAREHFERAVAIEPSYAKAWSKLAGIHWVRTMNGELPRVAGLSKTRAAAERALELDPADAEAHFRLAGTYWLEDEMAAADEHLARAIELEPNNALLRSYAAGDAAFNGRFDEAADQQRRAVEGDPMSAAYRDALAWWLYHAGRFDEARTEWLALLELVPDSMPRGLCFVQVLGRRFDEALDIVQRWPDGEDRRQCHALAHHGLGRRAEADAALAMMKERLDAPLRIAEVHAYRGEPGPAFEWLDRAFEQERADGPVGYPIWQMPHSPLLKPLHGDARWETWVRTVRQAVRDR